MNPQDYNPTSSNEPFGVNNQISDITSDTEIAMATQKEVLRQAQWSFNLYFAAIATSACIGAIGGGLLLTGKTTEGAVTAAAGLGSSAFCAQIGKESQEKLKMLMEYLQNLSSAN